MQLLERDGRAKDLASVVWGESAEREWTIITRWDLHDGSVWEQLQRLRSKWGRWVRGVPCRLYNRNSKGSPRS